MEKAILHYDDLLEMLDGLLREPKAFWENFYEDRDKEIPFFIAKGPDENLNAYVQNGLRPGKPLRLAAVRGGMPSFWRRVERKWMPLIFPKRRSIGLAKEPKKHKPI